MSVQIQVAYETNGELAEIVHLLSGVLDRIEYSAAAAKTKQVTLFMEELLNTSE